MKIGLNRSATELSQIIRLGLCALLLAGSQSAWALGDALNGQKIYPTCAGCHNIATNDLNIWSASGTQSDQGVPSAITTGIKNNPGPMGKYAPGGRQALSATDLADIAAYVNAVRYDNCLATPGTSGVTGKTGAACSTSSTGVTTLSPSTCAAQTMSWTVTGNMCDAAVPATKTGVSVTLNDTVAPATGSANYTCGANGVWSTPSSPSCTIPPPVNCTATTLSWTVGANTCNATAPATTSGSSTVLQDNIAPTTGSASYACSNGQWSTPTSASCATATITPPAPCAATTFTWTVGGNSCNASAAATTSGSSSILNDTTAPATGSASYTCTNGTWTGPASATCTVQQAGCAAATLTWTVGTSTCNASALAAASGASTALQDVTNPTTGAASFLCTNGAWGAASSATCMTVNTAQDCPATALNWTVGGNACSATAVPTVSGSTLSVTDTVAPSTGTAAFLCTNGAWTQSAGAQCSAAGTGPRGISSVNGEVLWRALLGSNNGACIDCHGAPKPDVVSNLLKINNAAGTAADQGTPSAIRRGIQNVRSMNEFAAVTDADLADIAAYVNATLYAKPLTTGTGTPPAKPYVIWQNGITVTSVVMPSTELGSVPSISVMLAIQAPSSAGLHIDRMEISNPLFTLNRVPVSLKNASPTAVAKACPANAFDLAAGEACGVEVVLTINKPGVETANLDIYTDPAQKPEQVALEASITAQASGGQGGGGCTMRSTPDLVDPVLWLMTVLSLAVLALRRRSRISSSL
jgi:hypothetical protein